MWVWVSFCKDLIAILKVTMNVLSQIFKIIEKKHDVDKKYKSILNDEYISHFLIMVNYFSCFAIWCGQTNYLSLTLTLSLHADSYCCTGYEYVTNYILVPICNLTCHTISKLLTAMITCSTFWHTITVVEGVGSYELQYLPFHWFALLFPSSWPYSNNCKVAALIQNKCVQVILLVWKKA